MIALPPRRRLLYNSGILRRRRHNDATPSVSGPAAYAGCQPYRRSGFPAADIYFSAWGVMADAAVDFSAG